MTEPKTIIGTSTVVTATVEGDVTLYVEGRVEGAISLSKSLVIEPSGTVKANITVESAVIRGALVGDIQATGSVQIAAGGRVIGNITAPRVVLEDGAAFRGGIDMGEFNIEERIKTAAAPVETMAMPPVSAPVPTVAVTVPSTPEPRISKRPQPRSRPSMQVSRSPAEPEPPIKSMAPTPRVRAIGRTRAKKKGG